MKAKKKKVPDKRKPKRKEEKVVVAQPKIKEKPVEALVFDITARVRGNEFGRFYEWFSDCKRYKLFYVHSKLSGGENYFGAFVTIDAPAATGRVIGTQRKTIEGAIASLLEYHRTTTGNPNVTVNESELVVEVHKLGFDNENRANNTLAKNTGQGQEAKPDNDSKQSLPTKTTTTKLEGKTMAGTLTVKQADAVSLFIALGFKKAKGWDVATLNEKLNVLGEMERDDLTKSAKKAGKEMLALLKSIFAAIDKEKEVAVEEAGKKKKKEEEPEPKKGKKTKKKKEDDDDEDGEEESDDDDSDDDEEGESEDDDDGDDEGSDEEEDEGGDDEGDDDDADEEEVKPKKKGKDKKKKSKKDDDEDGDEDDADEDGNESDDDEDDSDDEEEEDKPKKKAKVKPAKKKKKDDDEDESDDDDSDEDEDNDDSDSGEDEDEDEEPKSKKKGKEGKNVAKATEKTKEKKAAKGNGGGGNSAKQEKILKVMSKEPMAVGDICKKSKLSPPIRPILYSMLKQGLVKKNGDGEFYKKK